MSKSRAMKRTMRRKAVRRKTMRQKTMRRKTMRRNNMRKTMRRNNMRKKTMRRKYKGGVFNVGRAGRRMQEARKFRKAVQLLNPERKLNLREINEAFKDENAEQALRDLTIQDEDSIEDAQRYADMIHNYQVELTKTDFVQPDPALVRAAQHIGRGVASIPSKVSAAGAAMMPTGSDIEESLTSQEESERKFKLTRPRFKLTRPRFKRPRFKLPRFRNPDPEIADTSTSGSIYGTPGSDDGEDDSNA